MGGAGLRLLRELISRIPWEPFDASEGIRAHPVVVTVLVTFKYHLLRAQEQVIPKCQNVKQTGKKTGLAEQRFSSRA